MQTVKFNVLRAATSQSINIIRNVAVNNTTINVDTNLATKSWRDIPGPGTLPIIGQLHHFLPGGALYKLNYTDLFNTLHESYGPIIRLESLVGRPPMLVLYDAENSAKVLRGENWMPIRPGVQTLEYYRKNYAREHIDDPTGLLTEHDEVWKRFRSTVNPVMLHSKIIQLYTAPLEEVALDTLNRIRSLRGDDNMVKGNFDIEMNLWALESIGVVALGDRLDCLNPNLREDSPARQLIRAVHDFFHIVEKIEFQPGLWKYIATPTFKKAIKIYEDVENLTKYFVKRGQAKLHEKGKNSEDEKGVMEKLLEIDEKVAFVMASDMLFAGVDTTAHAAIYLLYLLAANPDKQEKLREEILMQNKQKPYLKACLKESFRLYPVVFGNLRTTTKEYNLLGYNIPKDTTVVTMHQAMSVSETQFTRPNDFIPERWLESKDNPLYHGNAHPFAYSPFGFGVRSCIGRRIAELELEILVAKVMENFIVGWKGGPLKVHQTSINYAAPPYNFIFKDLKRTE